MAVVAERRFAAHMISYELSRRFGIEREAFACDMKGRPLNVPRLLSETPIKANGFEMVTREVAPNQVEMVTAPSSEAAELLTSLRYLEGEVLALNDGDIRLQYLPRYKKPIGSLFDEVFATPRHKAILKALSHKEEGGEDWHHVYEMARVCATHFHMDFGREPAQVMVNACNLLNVAAPDILDWAHQEFRLPYGDRSGAWTRFACAERLPAPRWFADFAAYKALYESLPRLVRGGEKEGAGWEVDMRTRQVFGDKAAEGTTWWGVRWRPAYGTIEFRYLPTMPDPIHIIECAIAIDEWLTKALHKIGEKTYPTLVEALASNDIPPFKGRAVVRSDCEWWQRMNRF
jgi:gamma-glutamyl:cysteine ligase YbdK (ATP-grasp superfamily)